MRIGTLDSIPQCRKQGLVVMHISLNSWTKDSPNKFTTSFPAHEKKLYPGHRRITEPQIKSWNELVALGNEFCPNDVIDLVSIEQPKPADVIALANRIESATGELMKTALNELDEFMSRDEYGKKHPGEERLRSRPNATNLAELAGQ